LNLASHFNETTRLRAVRYLLLHHLCRTIEDAEDSVQDAFVNAWKHRASFRGHAKFSTWFTRIAVNEALMKRRTNAWKVSHFSDAVLSLPLSDGEMDSGEAIGTPALEYDPFLAKQLRGAISQLSPCDQQAVLCTYVYEWTLRETSNRLHVKLGTVKSRARRGKKKLQKLLNAA
jgi:RNA polymerase sigma-70 factor, ECF subfamily